VFNEVGGIPQSGPAGRTALYTAVQ